jgi:hypothetical protein
MRLDFEKKILNAYTSLCNLIDKEKIVVCYGDFVLDVMKEAITKLKLSKKDISFVYYDCHDKNPVDVFASFSVSSFGSQSIIYLFDNAEDIKKKDADFIMKYKYSIANSSKMAILCCLEYDKLADPLKKLRKFQIGEIYTEQLTYQQLILEIFNNENRNEAIAKITETDLSINYLLQLMSYNLNFFYPDLKQFQYNNKVLQIVSANLYKTDQDKLLTYLVYAIKITTIKRALKYPPRENINEHISRKISPENS